MEERQLPEPSFLVLSFAGGAGENLGFSPEILMGVLPSEIPKGSDHPKIPSSSALGLSASPVGTGLTSLNLGFLMDFPSILALKGCS